MTAEPLTLVPEQAIGAPVVRLLGPFEIDAVMVPTAKMPRQMLALLALRAQQQVSWSDFALELWGRDGHMSVPSIQTYVMRLRKIPEVVIETRHLGYALISPPPMDVDATRFVVYTEQARRQHDSGALLAAQDTLRAALSLWRGEPLEDVACGPLLSSWAAKIRDARRTALHLRRRFDLELGRHREILDELRADLRGDWTQEDVAVDLMVALYRSQRRAEALNIYRTVREALAEEHGLDPCPRLQRLQQQILSGDPALELNGAGQ